MRANHLNPKKFADALTSIPGWPTHAMLAWPPGNMQAHISVFIPGPSALAGGDAPFTAWEAVPQSTNFYEWMDPCTLGQEGLKWMYPSLLDHDSTCLCGSRTHTHYAPAARWHRSLLSGHRLPAGQSDSLPPPLTHHVHEIKHSHHANHANPMTCPDFAPHTPHTCTNHARPTPHSTHLHHPCQANSMRTYAHVSGRPLWPLQWCRRRRAHQVGWP